MKITVVTSPFLELPPIAIGAVEKLFYLLAGEWVKSGHKVSFVCCGGGDDSRMEFVRLKKYKRTGSTKRDLIWDFFYSIKALWKCPKTDILLCNTFWTPALAPLFHWKYKRLVYGVHRYPKGQFWLYPFVHAFICVSTAVADALRRQLSNRGGGMERVYSIVNPIDDSIFKGTPERDSIKGRVMFAGRVHPAKGLECLADACSRLYERNLCKELVLVGAFDSAKGGGGEDYIARIRQRARTCPVRVLGAIADPVKLADVERSAEVFVYPSTDAKGEACPIAPMESMALGVPTVVSGLSCYDDYVEDGGNALVFESGNAGDLESKLADLLLSDSARESLSKRAQTTIRSYSKTAVAAKYIDLLEAL